MTWHYIMKGVSAIFHPLLLATYMFTLIFLTAPELIGSISREVIPTLIMAVFLTTFLIPLFSIGVMRLTSKVSNFELTNREERILPFISITLFYAATSYMFVTQFRIGSVMGATLITVTLLIFSLLLITSRFKISIHSAANWATVGILSYLFMIRGEVMLYPLTAWILISGVVSSSRLFLGYHTPKEIWVGSIFGYLFAIVGLAALS